MTFFDIALRLCVATIIGGAIGLNRDLHGKPTGVRTLGLVSLGSALIVIAAFELAPPGASDPSNVGRVIQGILTGIGFLGAGVILRDANGPQRVHGLTTAACTWLTACVGAVCGAGNWRVIAVAVVLLFLLLLFGGAIERVFHRLMGGTDDAPPNPS